MIANKDKLLIRLKRIEGQVRGVHKMIEEDRYCVDILIQLAAIRAAINKVGLSVLESHTRGCVANALRQNQGEKQIEELMDVLMKFIK